MAIHYGNTLIKQLPFYEETLEERRGVLDRHKKARAAFVKIEEVCGYKRAASDLLCLFFMGSGGGLLLSMGLLPLLVCKLQVDKCSFSGTLSYCEWSRSFRRFERFSGNAGGIPLASELASASISCKSHVSLLTV
jgi:hypothetical protein